MIIEEIAARRVLSKSRTYDYNLNAYAGCAHGCIYCYADWVYKKHGMKGAKEEAFFLEKGAALMDSLERAGIRCLKVS